MATTIRYYFVPLLAPPVTPPAPVVWDVVTTPLQTGGLSTTHQTNLLYSTENAVTGGQSLLGKQWVSPALPFAGDTNGTWRIVSRMRKPTGVAATAYARWVLRLVSNDGTVVRKTLDGATSSPAYAGTDSYTRAGSGTWTANVQAGDRLVVEIGTIVSQNGRKGEFSNGSTGLPDIPWPVTDDTADGGVWFDFTYVEPVTINARVGDSVVSAMYLGTQPVTTLAVG